MKILFNTYYYAFQNPGGGETVLLKTKEALEKRGIVVDLFNKWNSKISQYDIIHNFSTQNYREFEGYKTYCTKLVVTPVMWPDISPAALLTERLKDVVKKLMGQRSGEVNFKAALNYVDLFCPTSSLEMDRIVTRYNLNQPNFRVINNGIDLPAPPNSENSFKSKYKLDSYYLYVGRISRIKNIEYIINACIDLNLNLAIVGEADLIEKNLELELKSKYMNFKNIIFTGFIPNNSPLLNDALHGTEALIVASLFETCSLVGLEAGARGTPVIMTDAGATTEIYSNFVKYISPHNILTLKKALSEKWSETQKQDLKKHIITNYTWDKIANTLINEYEKILKL